MPSAYVNGSGKLSVGEVDEDSGKSQDSRRTSFFRSRSFDNSQSKTGYNVSIQASNGNGIGLTRSNTEASDWVTDSGGGSHGSYDKRMLSGTPVDSIDKERESSVGAATPRLGGVKKRLSMLKLGTRKGRNNGAMGALNEE